MKGLWVLVVMLQHKEWTKSVVIPHYNMCEPNKPGHWEMFLLQTHEEKLFRLIQEGLYEKKLDNNE